MRISDWSSDVCSSDLACLHDGHQLARLAAAMTETLALAIPELPGLADDKLNQAPSSILFQELLSIIETSRPYIPSMSGAEILALTKRAFDAKRAKISRKEVGRASCRERVCQYVKISVVAGSRKK